MEKKVRDFIEKWNMIPAGTRVLCGVSGGADSVALLLLLRRIQRQREGTPGQFALEVIHVEHGIRGEDSLADAAFTRELCEAQDVPCRILSVDVPAYAKARGLGYEEAARELRYRCFRQAADTDRDGTGFGTDHRDRTGPGMDDAERIPVRIALAHHMEDNAETLLFQLARGSSMRGLSGMKTVREDEQGYCYIRPLLCTRKKELEQYLRNLGQDWRTDATNEDTDYSRNRIRHEILPGLEQINSRSVEHMNRCAEMVSEAADYMRGQMLEQYRVLVNREQDGGGTSLSLRIPGYLQCHPAIRRELLMELLADGCGRRKDIGALHVKQLADLAEGPTGRKIPLPYGVEAVRSYDLLILKPRKGKSEGMREIPSGTVIPAEMMGEVHVSTTETTAEMMGEEAARISTEGSLETPYGTLYWRTFSFDGNFQKISKNAYTKWVDYDKIKNGFCVRTRRSGDYLVTDVQGHRKKLSRYFIDEKIPSSEREETLLLASDSEILWVIGGRISESVKITERTEIVTELSFRKGEQDGFYKEV